MKNLPILLLIIITSSSLHAQHTKPEVKYYLNDQPISAEAASLVNPSKIKDTKVLHDPDEVRISSEDLVLWSVSDLREKLKLSSRKMPAIVVDNKVYPNRLFAIDTTQVGKIQYLAPTALFPKGAIQIFTPQFTPESKPRYSH